MPEDNIPSRVIAIIQSFCSFVKYKVLLRFITLLQILLQQWIDKKKSIQNIAIYEKKKVEKVWNKYQCKWWGILHTECFIHCDALPDLVSLVQFKKREKHPWRSVTFSKVADLVKLQASGFRLQASEKLLWK